MVEKYIVGMLAMFFIAIFLIQNFRVRKLIPEYKNLKDAINKNNIILNSLIEQCDKKKDELKTVEIKLKDTTAMESSILLRNNTLIEKKNNLELCIEETKRHLILETSNLEGIKKELSIESLALTENRKNLEALHVDINIQNEKMKNLLLLKKREEDIENDIITLELKRDNINRNLNLNIETLKKQANEIKTKKNEYEINLSILMGKIDLYSRVDEYTQVGHFDTPQYFYETSIRYQSEIKHVREKQKLLINAKKAVLIEENFNIFPDRLLSKKTLEGQAFLMLNAFNIECDLLINKVSPSNLDRTLEQIEKKAEELEKNCATFRCGFNIDYVELKFKECKLQFEFMLKKQSEQEQQRIIREQMKEEIRVQKQYEEAVKDTEKEELKFRRLIEKARENLAQEKDQDRALTLAKISLLEEQLKEAEERLIRAKSMAEQTRRGFVYVISNIGAFGDGVYKIGLTRRLDPQERVDELSGASVPFPFDVHAMCFSDDAPALENALHKRFSNHRVNAVQLRKEFFRVTLNEIQDAIQELSGNDVEFKVMAHAKEYYESKRLLPAYT